MAPRPYWKGYLKLSLVSCPIALYPATTTSERVSFRQINRKTGHRLRQQLVDDETREPVDSEDRGRGYEVGPNQYIQVEDEELEAIQIESTHTVDIDSFVPRAQIDKRYFDSPYYIVPNDNVGQEAFAVIREAMRGDDMVALGRIVIAKRERVVALEPLGKGLLGTALRYPYEVRNENDYFSDLPDIKVQGEMLKLAKHIISEKTGEFDPSQMQDHYETALVELLRQKQEHQVIPKKGKAAPAPNVINLMDALRRSVQAEQRAPAQPKRPRKKLEGQKEMLLPIQGKGSAREAAPKASKPARTGRVAEGRAAGGRRAAK